ncbi:flagellar assembly protein FliH [Gallaecimonas sp. GXIMD4217]|uniref:flagellar assembly protein FliH n=1 Tax=Gallaecimonas sp. GXIMD4217 TaxID=3131927 RepID=UPI00311AF0D3
MKKSEPQPGEAIERWEGPHFGEDQADEVQTALGLRRRRIQQDEPEPAPGLQGMTVTELDELRQAAVEEGREQGRAQGYEAGFAEGRAAGLAEGQEQGRQQGLQQGLAEGQQQVAQAAGHWQRLADCLSEPLADRDAVLEGRLITLLSAAMKALLQAELKTQPELIHHLIRQGIEALGQEESPLTLLLAPADLHLVREYYGEEELQARRWRLREEPTLQPGQCRLEQGQSLVDLDLHARLQQLCQALLVEAGQDHE